MKSEALHKDLGSRIRSLRIQAGISQATLSERVGIFRTHLSRIECGIANPSLTVIVAIARALKAHPVVLLGGLPEASGAD